MARFKYVIVGGGMTGDSAVRGIREIDQDGSIAMISMETDPPYDRPPLSKGLWKGKPFEEVWRGTKDLGVDLRLGQRVVDLNPERQEIIDDQGTTHSFSKLLLATGGTARRLPFGLDQIIYYRTIQDYRRLSALAEQHKRFAVIGGGFIGSEVAAALAMNGQRVALIFPEAGIGARLYPPDLAQSLNDFYRQKGVDVLPAEHVVGFQERGSESALLLRNATSGKESEIVIDVITAGIGIQPNMDLARAAGLRTDNGIYVDSFLRTDHPSILAAGDVANFRNPALGTRMRVEHEDNANTMGQVAGRNMAGNLTEYNHLPFFYSDLFELGYEAVGILDSRMEMVAEWKEPYREGVVYYLADSRVRGVLLWNTWGQVDAARRLIAEPGPFKPEDLKDRLPE